MSASPTTNAGGSAGSSGAWEVASGVDALYMSGHAQPPEQVFERLKVAREIAVESDEPVGIEFGHVDFNVEPHGFGRYKYCLRDAFGIIGVSPSEKLPTVRIQPKSEFLHRAGVEEVVKFYHRLLEREMGDVELTASRLDLYIDTQGWSPRIDERHKFVRRASGVSSYEENDEFTGLTFGKRSTGTVYARIYDKTIEINKKKDYFVEQVWGEKYEPALPVIRTEFQIGRAGLKAYGISTVDEALMCAPALWSGLTTDWLSLRQVSADSNRSRWPVAPEWLVVQDAALAGNAVGLKRMAVDHRNADLMSILPGLAGFVSSAAAITGIRTLPEALAECERLIRGYTNSRHKSFEEIVAIKIGERSFTIPESLQ